MYHCRAIAYQQYKTPHHRAKYRADVKLDREGHFDSEVRAHLLCRRCSSWPTHLSMMHGAPDSPRCVVEGSLEVQPGARLPRASQGGWIYLRKGIQCCPHGELQSTPDSRSDPIHTSCAHPVDITQCILACGRLPRLLAHCCCIHSAHVLLMLAESRNQSPRRACRHSTGVAAEAQQGTPR